MIKTKNMKNYNFLLARVRPCYIAYYLAAIATHRTGASYLLFANNFPVVNTYPSSLNLNLRAFSSSLTSMTAHKPSSFINNNEGGFESSDSDLDSIASSNSIVHESINKSMGKSLEFIGNNKVKGMQNALFTEIRSLLVLEGFNEKTQCRIEELIFDYVDKISSNSDNLITFLSGFDSSIFSNRLFITFIFKKLDLYSQYVGILDRSLRISSEEKKSNKRDNNIKFEGLLKNIFCVLKKEDFISPSISCLLRCITFYNVSDKNDTDFYLNTEISLSIEIGRKIVNKFVRVLYKNSDLAGKYRLVEFIDALFQKDEFVDIDFDSDEVYAFIGLKFINIMYQADLLKSNLKTFGYKQQNYMVGLSDELCVLFDKKIYNKPLHISLNLPMIVEPKDYVCVSNTNLTVKSGGYCLNNELFTQPLINHNHEQPDNPVFTSTMVLDTLNNMMKVPFKINTDLLDFLVDNHKLLLLDDYHPLIDKVNRSKREESEFQSYTSKKILENYVLLIANTYRDVPSIYFPLMLDFRGRIYNKVTYLNYQGSELAKALILFTRPCDIYRNNTSAIEYLKAYTANSYGHGLGKKSYRKRIE